MSSGSAGVYGVRWLGGGRHIALNRRHAWDIFGLDGSRVRLTADTRDYERGAAASPVGALLACANAEQAQVIDAGTGAVKYHWDLNWVNNSNRRFDWTPDGRYLLLNDLVGVRVWDMRDGRLAYSIANWICRSRRR